MTQQTAIESTINTLLATMGEDVTLLIGETAIEGRALRGKTDDQAYDAQGLTVELRSIDFIFNALLLLNEDDERVIPQRGNQIVAGADVYTVLPLTNEGKCAESRDPFGVMLRVHTKRSTAGSNAGSASESTFTRRERSVVTMTADTPLTITASGLNVISSVEVWRRNDNGTLTQITAGVEVVITEATPPVVTITSGITLTNARVFLVGT